MRRVVYTIALAALAGLPTLSSHGQESGSLRKLMQRKLQASQKVLEGIAVNDFDKIRDGATELQLVRKAAGWRVMKTPQYELFSDEFARNAETLSRMAGARNIDGAALAYVDLTLNCVRCHKHVREVRMTHRDGSPVGRETVARHPLEINQR